MPWYVDANGQRKYRLSMYAKEELPTWSEVYDEFYMNQYYDDRTYYTDEMLTKIDPYWKIERYKVLLATVCNQFNKMIFEDGYKSILQKAFEQERYYEDEAGRSVELVDIIFTCDPYTGREGNPRYDTLNVAPPIYTIPLPTGKPNPFIIGKHPRSDITKFTDPLEFRAIIDLDTGVDEYDYMQIVPGAKSPTGYLFDWLLELMMQPYKEYFKNATPQKPTGTGQCDPAL